MDAGASPSPIPDPGANVGICLVDVFYVIALGVLFGSPVLVGCVTANDK